MSLKNELEKRKEDLEKYFSNDKVRTVEIGTIVDIYIEDTKTSEGFMFMGMITDEVPTEEEKAPQSIYFASELGKLIMHMEEDQTVTIGNKEVSILNVFENYDDFSKRAYGRSLDIASNDNRIGLGSIVNISIDDRTYDIQLIANSNKFKRIPGVQEAVLTAPLGKAIYGCQENDEVNYSVFNEQHKAVILKVYKNILEYQNQVKKSKSI